MSPTRRHLLRRSACCIAALLLLVCATVLPHIAQGAPVTVYWDTNGTAAGSGNAGGTWDNATTANWTTNSAGTTATATYNSADGGSPGNVIFSAGNNATGAFTVTVSGPTAVEANSITFEEGAITLAGSSTPSLTIDAGGVTVSNTVNGATTFASSLGTVIAGGTNTSASQTWANNSSQNFIVNSGVEIGKQDTLTFAGSGATIVNGVISQNSGSGSNKGQLVKDGSGVLTLSNANTYSGGTSIKAGTLTVTNTTGSATGGAVTFTNTTGTATLSSGAGTSGIITGKVTTANANSIITPGGAGTVGALTLSGGLDASAGATFNFDLGSTANHDLISLGGAAFTGPSAVNSAALKISFNGLSGVAANTTYQLFTYGSDPSLDAGDFSVVNSPGFSGATFTVTGSEVDVKFGTVPEPSTWFAAGLSLLFIGYTQRRKLVPALKRFTAAKPPVNC